MGANRRSIGDPLGMLLGLSVPSIGRAATCRLGVGFRAAGVSVGCGGGSGKWEGIGAGEREAMVDVLEGLRDRIVLSYRRIC